MNTTRCKLDPKKKLDRRDERAKGETALSESRSRAGAGCVPPDTQRDVALLAALSYSARRSRRPPASAALHGPSSAPSLASPAQRTDLSSPAARRPAQRETSRALLCALDAHEFSRRSAAAPCAPARPPSPPAAVAPSPSPVPAPALAHPPPLERPGVAAIALSSASRSSSPSSCGGGDVGERARSAGRGVRNALRRVGAAPARARSAGESGVEGGREEEEGAAPPLPRVERAVLARFDPPPRRASHPSPRSSTASGRSSSSPSSSSRRAIEARSSASVMPRKAASSARAAW